MRVKYRDTWIQAAGIPLITVLEYYLTYSVYKTGWLLIYELCSDALKIWIIWQAIKQTIVWLDKKMPYQGRFVKRLLLQVLLTSVLGIGALTLMVQVEYAYIRPYPNQHFFNWDIVIAFLFILQANLIYIGLYFYQSYLEKQHAPQLGPSLAEATEAVSHLMVKLGSKAIKLDFEDVLFFFSESKETFAFNKDERLFPVDYSLDKLEAMLDENFFRANRQLILTRKVVSEIMPDVNGKLSVRLHSYNRLPGHITVSRTKAHSFRKWMSRTPAVHP